MELCLRWGFRWLVVVTSQHSKGKDKFGRNKQPRPRNICHKLLPTKSLATCSTNIVSGLIGLRTDKKWKTIGENLSHRQLHIVHIVKSEPGRFSPALDFSLSLDLLILIFFWGKLKKYMSNWRNCSVCASSWLHLFFQIPQTTAVRVNFTAILSYKSWSTEQKVPLTCKLRPLSRSFSLLFY